MPKPLNVIVACAENRVIGREGRQPWRLPEDTAFFHAKTTGQIVVLGRICFETWPAATRDGRRPVVVTRRHDLARPGVAITPSLSAALAVAEALPGEIYICGGQRIYEEALALPLSQPLRLYLTLIHAEVSGDRFFPDWRSQPWTEVSRRESADKDFRYTFLTLDRLEPKPGSHEATKSAKDRSAS